MLWIVFHLVLVVVLFLDLRHRAQGWKAFALWSVAWVLVALAWNGVIYGAMGKAAALEFFTAFLLEKSLSVDNLCVFLLIFSSFHVPAEYQRRVLFWGIVGAVLSRLILVLAGIKLIEGFHQVIYLFGAFLVYGGLRFLFATPKARPIHHHWFVRWMRRHFPIVEHFGEGHLRSGGKWTLLAVVLLLMEGSDLVFALDSIPAVLAITQDPLVAYTSNVCAILGLRSLYFTLAPWLQHLHKAKWGLGLILVFVGSKMLLESVWMIPTSVTLAVIALILVMTFLVQRLRRKSKGQGDLPFQ